MSELELAAARVSDAGAVGVVPTDGRGGLPFSLLHGESLVAVAAWTAGAAGVELLDLVASWESVVRREAPLVVHDPLCPGAPAAFLAEAVETSLASGAVVVGVRPVTDTVKERSGEVLGATVDRAGLVAVASPVVLPAAVVAGLEDWPDLDDLVAWVEQLRGRWPVSFLEAPAAARRVADESDLRLLEAATRPE